MLSFCSSGLGKLKLLQTIAQLVQFGDQQPEDGGPVALGKPIAVQHSEIVIDVGAGNVVLSDQAVSVQVGLLGDLEKSNLSAGRLSAKRSIGTLQARPHNKWLVAIAVSARESAPAALHFGRLILCCVRPRLNSAGRLGGRARVYACQIGSRRRT